MSRLVVAAVLMIGSGCASTEPSPPPPVPPSSGWIYFAESRHVAPSRTQLWRIRPDGTGRELVPNPDESLAGPEFDVSRDGRQIALNRGAALYIVPADRPGDAYLASEPDLYGFLRWAPDGRYIARSRREPATGNWQLVLTAANAGEEILLLESSGGLWAREWFPDGDSLTYLDTRTGYRVLRLATGTTRPLTPLSDWIFPSPSGRFGIEWSVDSVYHDTKRHWRLYDLTTGMLVTQVTHRQSPRHPAWSPDERHFVTFCQERQDGLPFLGLCVYERETLQPVMRLADPTPETLLDYPRWIP